MIEPRIELRDGYFLRGLQDDDDGALAHWLGSSDVASFLPFLPRPYGLIEARAWIAHRTRFREAHGHEIHFGIRDPHGSLIGSVSLDDFRIGQTHNAEIGYWLEPSSRQHGLGTAAVRAFVHYAFTTLALERISATTLIDNEPSAALLQRVGFHEEGVRRKFVRVGPAICDVRLFGILRTA
jgi:RimJ/RimL family protein N-acetyltransferase